MEWKEAAKKCAEDHVDWYQKTTRQELIEQHIHGFKHGVEWAKSQPVGRGFVQRALTCKHGNIGECRQCMRENSP